MFEGRSTAAFPATFAANATQPFPLTIYPPALPPGAVQGTYRLRVDVYDPATATWFAAKGNQPLDNPVIVTKDLATKLGFERFHQYEGEPVGAGMSSVDQRRQRQPAAGAGRRSSPPAAAWPRWST